ncbi:MAG: sigma-70 family RNA polymerase sigma factor [Acidobacteria bacterium]|nr:sigma-70 family RNA polymerase sigma factor [Acidobacteriota bacterium]MBI3655528.1 sigma-70 family RNA polymerase sigma factor [Acidobacteriota bacterium]
MSLLVTKETTLDAKLAHLTDILVNYARSKQIKPEDARDIAQEAIKDLSKDSRRIEETDLNELMPWVFAVMKREMSMFFRTKQRKKNLLDKAFALFRSAGSSPSAFNNAEENILKQERRELILKVLAGLGPTEQRLYELTIDGYESPQIARELGLSVLCVRKKLSRLRNLLAQKLTTRRLKFQE